MATIAEQVQQVYIGLLGRAAEKAGLDYWVNEITTGKITLDQVRANFVSSQDEYITGIGQMSRPDAITALYNNLFERDPEAEGLAYWNTGGGKDIAIDGLLFALIDGAALSDATALENKTEVADYYTAATAAGQAYDAAKAAAVIANVGADAQSVLDGKALVDGVNGDSVNLTVNQDDLTGTAAADTFNAYIFDNQNTAQSGDMVDGGAGTDRLYADIGNSQDFAVTLSTESVEQFAVRAETSNTSDETDNNLVADVTIDAERMEGTNWYESNNSRADVIIEDVRIERVAAYNDATDQITRDITVAMVSTDPGNVDLGVYFDQHSLVKSGAAVSNSITLNVGNQLETALGYDSALPLDNIPYDQVSFVVNGTTVTLNIDLTGVDTYAQMFVALQAAFATEKQTNAALLDVNLTRTLLTEDFISKDGENRQADEYILTTENGTIEPAAVGWNASAGLPSNNAFSASVVKGDSTTTSSLITSTIVLDDVGRGSMGGDLVVGGLSTGDTSNSKGVEQFDITVERSSQLKEIQSTNNTLREVYIKNGAVKGDLTVAGTGAVDTTNSDLPGADSGANGFDDVRVVDASAMEGKVSIQAHLSEKVVAKYMDNKDFATDSKADDVDFRYELGSNDDMLNLSISNANLDAAGTSTRDDFILNIEGNGGNDVIKTIIGNGAGTDSTNWYLNSQKNANLSIDSGTGNDTITTTGAGDFKIDAGAGNDTVYANNDGNGTVAATTAASVTIVQNTDGVAEVVENSTFTVSDATGTTGTVSIEVFADGASLGVAGPFAINATAATIAAAIDALSATLTDNGAGVITYVSAAAGDETDVSYTITTAGVGADGNIPTTPVNVTQQGVDGVNEQQTVTFSNGNVGDTIFFDGELTTLVDTNGSGTVEASEVAAQVVTSTNNSTGTWNAVNAGNGSVTLNGAAFGNQAPLTITDIIGGGTYSATTAVAATSSTAATWLVNANNQDIADLQGAGASTDYFLVDGKVTVSFAGANGAAGSGVINGPAGLAGATGFNVTVDLDTSDYVVTAATINQAIKEAINEDPVLSKLLVATDGPAHSLVIKSLVDGQFAVDDLDINVSDASTTFTAAQQSAYEDFTSNSNTTNVLNTAVITGQLSSIDSIPGLDADAPGNNHSVFAQDNGSNLVGTTSTSTSDNTITLGSGDDVAVLGTDANSNDTLVFSGVFGNDSIYNFDTDTAAGSNSVTADAEADILDFTAYLGGLQTTGTSTSVVSQSTIATTGVAVTAAGTTTLIENQVAVVSGFSANGSLTETWANLTANDLLAAIQDTNTTSYGNIANASFDVNENSGTFVGSTIKNVVLIENAANLGEYKVFELTATGGSTDEFTAAQLVGTIDFGNTINGATVELV